MVGLLRNVGLLCALVAQISVMLAGHAGCAPLTCMPSLICPIPPHAILQRQDIVEVGVCMPRRLEWHPLRHPHYNGAGTDSPLTPKVQHYWPQYFLLPTGTFQQLAG